MTCPSCGAEAAQGAAFCPSCGRGLVSTRVTASQAERESPADAARAGQSSAPAIPPPVTPPGGHLQASRWSEAKLLPFRHGNEWYMDRDGTVYRWRSEAAEWAPEPAGAAPFFMRRPKFTSLKTPAVVLFVLLGLFAAFTAMAVAADAYQFTVLDELESGDTVSQSRIDGAQAFYDAAKVLQSFCILGIAPVFIWWLRRATCNVRALGVARPRFTPGWSIAWWFIPFANLVQPLRVVFQAWRASDPALPPAEHEDLRGARLSPLLFAWWIGYQLISGAWSVVFSSADDSSVSDEAKLDLTSALIALDSLMIGVTALAVWLVWSLTQRQQKAEEKFAASEG